MSFIILKHFLQVYMCTITANATFVESNLLWHIILKLTYILPSNTTNFYYIYH